jgi:hypothetical protein|eukprot:COSAG03_NODE_782_length_5876_cov_3.589233_9_plen_101_part_00
MARLAWPSLLALGLSVVTPRALLCDAAADAGGWKFEGWYPNHYVARRLGPAEKITIDGKLVRALFLCLSLPSLDPESVWLSCRSVGAPRLSLLTCCWVHL